MFCSQCGKENPTAARFCFGCGAQLGPAAAPPPLPGASPTGTLGTGSSTLGLGSTADAAPVYAGFWRRFAALVLDAVILSFVASIISGVMTMFMGAAFMAAASDAPGSGGIGALSAGLSALSFLLILACGWLYFALSEASSWQATLGKRALGIYVTDVDGRRISMLRATGRWLGRMLNWVTMGIGWLLAAFTERKQGLHDLVAGTVVMARDRNASPVLVVVILVIVALPVLIVTLSIVLAGFAAAAGQLSPQ